ncbi:hypothetical protein F4780DRAFT_466403 [Xylariomycetidae sp. FL0641]|nr:hypothetical protein F4780DRAFT_466403 [Xylariomycetidae sp. FL0641]
MAITHLPGKHHYRVRVRDYHWSKHKLLVQSPVLSLADKTRKVIVRPLEGKLKKEATIVAATDLKDDVDGPVYETEAHGLLVTGASEAHSSPVWVPVQCGKAPVKENQTRIINLTTLEDSIVPIAQVCWLANSRAPDGALCTIIGAQRTLRLQRQQSESSVMVLLQQVGSPQKAGFALLATSILSAHTKLDEAQQRCLFDVQYQALQKQPGPLPPFGTRQSYTNSKSHRPQQTAIVRGVLGPYRSPFVNRNDSIDFVHSESESSEDGDVEDELPAAPTKYTCECKYADLGPTYRNLRPAHRHVTDEQCSRGAKHRNHCVFAEHRPQHCVISGSSEQHEHCQVTNFTYAGNPVESDALVQEPMTDSANSLEQDGLESEMDVYFGNEASTVLYDSPESFLVGSEASSLPSPPVTTSFSSIAESEMELLGFQQYLEIRDFDDQPAMEPDWQSIVYRHEPVSPGPPEIQM